MGGDAKDKKGEEGKTNNKFLGVFPESMRDWFGPLVLIMLCSPFVIVLQHLLQVHTGDIFSMRDSLTDKGKKGLLEAVTGFPSWWMSIVPDPFDAEAWKLIGIYSAFELALMRLLPGKEFRANHTSTGHVPVYKANGMQSYVVTLVTYGVLVYTGLFQSYRVYDKFGEIISGLALMSFVFVGFLTFKGLYFPSTADSGTNGNIIKDFFWGTELYPRVFGWDVKVFTNCRFGMMYWAVGILCYAHHQIHYVGSLADSMFVSVALQLVYIAKFFWWETGYFNSMDIQHDRAGYYICWGCLVWVPSVYTSASFFLATHPVQLGNQTAGTILGLGLLSIWANYDADRQRAHFRRVNGKCNIWGKPAEFITASYMAGKEQKTSLLLTSGWWGLSRHFHYLPEITASLCWCCPGLGAGIMPYFYVVFLTILLFDRAYRDDKRCGDKYGQDWAKYCALVPKKVIPGII